MPGTSTYASDEQGRGSHRASQVIAPWAARARHPAVARQGSREEIVIEVSGPVPLRGTLVDVGVELREGGDRRWEAAYWQETDGYVGVCATLLGVGNLRLRPGWYRLLVRPSAAGQQPILNAGQLIVE